MRHLHARQTAHGIEAQGGVVHQDWPLQLLGGQAALLCTDPLRLTLRGTGRKVVCEGGVGKREGMSSMMSSFSG